jgi:hypothetical protein
MRLETCLLGRRANAQNNRQGNADAECSKRRKNRSSGFAIGRLLRARTRISELALSSDCARLSPLARFAFILFIPSILAKNSSDAEHQIWPCQRYSNGFSEQNMSQDGGDGQDKYDG